VVGLNSQSLTTETFADEKSCIQAGKKVTVWINDNDERWRDKSKFKCLAVSGK
tara:strand:+ start:353 stop:511 length:159 start_codon:yes stop_codon:yes gene_type:complete